MLVQQELSIEEEDEAMYDDARNDVAKGALSEENESDDDGDEDDVGSDFERITVGVCAMAKKVSSKPMGEILSRLGSCPHFELIIFREEVILHEPVDNWPRCEALISFYSKDFPLRKAQAYAQLRNPFLINDLDKQWDIMVRGAKTILELIDTSILLNTDNSPYSNVNVPKRSGIMVDFQSFILEHL